MVGLTRCLLALCLARPRPRTQNHGKIWAMLAIVLVLGAMMFGPASPVLCGVLCTLGWYRSAGALALVLLASLYPTPVYSARFCRFYLSAAGWFDQGVWMHVERTIAAAMATNNGSMWCLHPHGTAIGFGFSLNGAVRFKVRFGEVSISPPPPPPLRVARQSPTTTQCRRRAPHTIDAAPIEGSRKTMRLIPRPLNQA